MFTRGGIDCDRGLRHDLYIFPSGALWQMQMQHPEAAERPHAR